MMATGTLEQRTLNVENILKDFKKALRSRNPEMATDKIRILVSDAAYHGEIGTYELVNLARQTSELVEKYRKKPYCR